ncbi:hypothetical protein BDN72DRAFT_863366 [Pluteus cervinus]|uniref:Uncharacterized protein n=1 Tax=Pluteus cervinus TaxID=181527 RepID=A0ACD3A8L5_9AGAR|nr:hypothetical protein BDN72DRAFT_863366 [Pluteus cervinus]
MLYTPGARVDTITTTTDIVYDDQPTTVILSSRPSRKRKRTPSPDLKVLRATVYSTIRDTTTPFAEMDAPDRNEKMPLFLPRPPGDAQSSVIDEFEEPSNASQIEDDETFEQERHADELQPHERSPTPPQDALVRHTHKVYNTGHETAWFQVTTDEPLPEVPTHMLFEEPQKHDLLINYKPDRSIHCIWLREDDGWNVIERNHQICGLNGENRKRQLVFKEKMWPSWVLASTARKHYNPNRKLRKNNPAADA